MKKKLMMILIFLLSVVLAQEASASFLDFDLTQLYGTAQSKYGDWALALTQNPEWIWYSSWPFALKVPLKAPSNRYPVTTFQEVITGQFSVTEANSREFSFDFSSLLGLSLKNATLNFSVTGPKKGSEEVTLWADGEEIFSSKLSQSQKNYQINLLKVDPASLQDGELTLTFSAPEDDYFIPRLSLNMTAQGPATAVPIPAGLWLFGSGLGTLLIGRIKKR